MDLVNCWSLISLPLLVGCAAHAPSRPARENPADQTMRALARAEGGDGQRGLATACEESHRLHIEGQQYDPNAHRELQAGYVHKDEARAIEAYRKSATLCPSGVWSARSHAKLCAMLCNKALAVDGHSMGALRSRGLQHCEEALARIPRLAEARIHLLLGLYDAGATSRCVQVAREGLRQPGQSDEALAAYRDLIARCQPGR